MEDEVEIKGRKTKDERGETTLMKTNSILLNKKVLRNKMMK